MLTDLVGAAILYFGNKRTTAYAASAAVGGALASWAFAILNPVTCALAGASVYALCQVISVALRERRGKALLNYHFLLTQLSLGVLSGKLFFALSLKSALIFGAAPVVAATICFFVRNRSALSGGHAHIHGGGGGGGAAHAQGDVDALTLARQEQIAAEAETAAAGSNEDDAVDMGADDAPAAAIWKESDTNTGTNPHQATTTPSTPLAPS
jgi:hypothetical protein